ncbi:MAG: primosomal protein N' [Phycisphaerae bacterium]|nr:primosomal protein N' [Phycisphaerae bacterium]
MGKKEIEGQLGLPWAPGEEKPQAKPRAESKTGLIAQVAIDAPLDKIYSYRVPDEMKDTLKAGMLVRVPMGRHDRMYRGVVLEVSTQVWQSTLKAIESIMDDRMLFSEKILTLGRWLSDYYVTPIGLAMSSLIPSAVLKGGGKTLRVKPFIKESPPQEPEFGLNDDQHRVMQRIEAAVEAEKFHVMLVHGVTASGKTELYIKAIQRVLSQGKGAIYLVPEIALTAQMIERLSRRFEKVAVLHSGLTESQRRATWEAVERGEVRVVVGTRSAVFAPVPDLGLIVVDEEQEPSFKNMASPRYNTRDLAIKRTHIEGIPIILGSATPSLETYFNSTHLETWEYLSLPKRVADLPMPPVMLVDMEQEAFDRKGVHLVSRLLEDKIRLTLEKDKQVMLLLNRRGYAGYVFCPSCKYVLVCPSCGTRMVYHKSTDRAICHHCSARVDVPNQCDRCGHKMNKFGLGTQRVEEELERKFPEIRLSRMDADTMSTTKDYEAALTAFAKGETNVLLGTQMIAKGLDFPNVALVGVLSADMVLSLPDFRAGERTFQLLAQVGGRAGRADYASVVVVQSYNLQDPAIQAALHHDYLKFAQGELYFRKRLNLPPYSRMARLVISHVKISQTRQIAGDLAQELKRVSKGLQGVSVTEPAPAVMPRLRNRYRFQILIKSPNASIMKEFMTRARNDEKVKLFRREIMIDVDPVDLL